MLPKKPRSKVEISNVEVDAPARIKFQEGQRDSQTQNWMEETDGLKEDVGEAVPLSTTARLLTSKRGADRSLDRNVLLGQVMSIEEGDLLREIQRGKRWDMVWNGIWLETHSLARLLIEGFVGDAVREAPGHSQYGDKRADRQSGR
jgi:hypothetical protein